MEIVKNLEYLINKYDMKIPCEYIDFIKNSEFFDYNNCKISVFDVDLVLNHFLKVDEQNPSRDVCAWYFFGDEEREEFLTIALGCGDEEIAIKVKGENLGGIYLIRKEENLTIKKLFDNFVDFKNILIKGE